MEGLDAVAGCSEQVIRTGCLPMPHVADNVGTIVSLADDASIVVHLHRLKVGDDSFVWNAG